MYDVVGISNAKSLTKDRWINKKQLKISQRKFKQEGNIMIYTDQQLIKKIRKMIIDFEDEVVEFKEARTSYSFKDIGKYFYALGNEAKR